MPETRRAPGLAAIERSVSQLGLACRGAFVLRPNELRADDGECIRTIVLIGNAGPTFWPVFEQWWREHPDVKHPLDTWSKHVIGELAKELGAQACFPSDGPPFRPFQQWAMRAEPVHVSPLMVLMHPLYGPWHAYRGALLFSEKIVRVSDGKLAAAQEQSTALAHSLTASALISPCVSCVGKPCLCTCPVSAFSGDDYDVDACENHLRSEAGKPCMSDGCIARRACPVGIDYQYPEAQMQFHLRAFLNRH